MNKKYALFFLVLLNFFSSHASDSLKIYPWDEAKQLDPSLVFGISFEKLKLDSLPAELARFKNVQYLNLSKNKLHKLPDFMRDFDSLKVLDLHKNNFTVFPMQICAYQQIEKLILSRNDFEQIPECIQYLRKLNYLDLSDTPVSAFPEAFVSMPQLKTLVLHGLAYPPSFHAKWKERLPWMRIEFDPPCHCLE
jgi:Leucine-rich repeat (LRR) protein